MRQRRTVMGALLVTTLAATVHSAGGMAGASSAPAGEPLRIVGLINESGQYATSGSEALQGLEIRIDQLNEAGGVLGRPLVLETLDTESDTARSTQLAQSIAASDDLLGVIGPQGGATCYATREALDENGVLHYCDSGAPIPGEDGPGEPAAGYFGMYAGPAYAGARIITEFVAARDIGSVGVVRSNDTSGEMYGRLIEEAAAAGDLELAGVETFDADDVDLSTQIANLDSSGAEMIYVGTTGPGLVTALQAINDLGLDVPVFAGWGNATTAQAELVKDLLPSGGLFVYGDLVHVWEQLPEDDPDRAQFAEIAPLWEERYDTGPTWGGVANYDAVSIFAMAAEAVGSNDSAAMAEWILSELGTFDGLAYTYHFTPDNHRGTLGSGLVVQYTEDGAFEIAEQFEPETADG